MKYICGMLLLMLAALFLVLPIFTFFKISLTDIYEDPFLLAAIFIFGFGILFLKGAYYCFKFSDLFTKTIVFSENEISISDNKNNAENLPNDKIIKIIYIKALKLFEIHFKDLQRKEIIVMNNAGYETKDFLALKKFLLSSQKSTEKWL